MHKGEWSHDICGEMAESGDCRVKWNKPDSEREVPHQLSSVELIFKNKKTRKRKGVSLGIENKPVGGQDKGGKVRGVNVT